MAKLQLPTGHRDFLMRIQRGRCGICWQLMEGEAHVDHLVPKALGGKDDLANLQLAHPSCNRKKGDRFLQRWRGGELLPNP